MVHSPSRLVPGRPWKRLLVPALLLALACAASWRPLWAQTAADLSVLDVQDGAFPDVSMVVSVTMRGRPVPGLDASSFRVAEDTGAPARVTAVSQAQDNALPVGVVIAVDTSGSMSDPIAPGQPAKIEVARQSAKQLIEQLGANDQVGIVSFASKAETAAAISTDHAAAEQALDRLTAPPGWTALYDAGVTALDVAHSSGLQRVEVVLLTDGKEEGDRGLPSSQHTRQDVLDRAREYGISLLTIGVGSDQDAGTLRTFATATGGTYTDAQDAGAVQQAFNDAGQALRTQYNLTFRSGAPADHKAHNVSVSVALPGGGSATANASFMTRAIAPSLSIATRPPGGQPSPLAGDTLTLDAPREILFQADGQAGAPRIRYTLQGQDPVVLQAPYQPLSLDPLQMKVGDLSLTVEATDTAGNVTSRNLRLTVPALPPPVQVPGIHDGSTLTGATKVQPQIASRQAAIRQVAYTLDHRAPEVFNTPPFEYVINTDALTRGPHSLHIAVTDTNDQAGSYDLPFRVAGTSFNPALLFVFGGLALVMIFLTGFVGLRVQRRRRPAPVGALPAASPLPVAPVAQARPAPAAPAPVAVAPAPPRAPVAGVLEISGDGAGARQQPIFEGVTVLGREVDCEVFLEDPHVSRHHARITAARGSFRVEDLGSRIGTRCDGTPLVQGRPVELPEGGRIRIGPYTMTLHRQ